ncbi:MAG: hypothetical protein VB066_02395 [Paludibacter sp.]|nr:hypothetical protein [Paludibacter sp.]
MTVKFSFPMSHGLKKVGLPLIVTEINQHNLCFLLDTGSNKNLIDQRVFEFFKDHFEPVGNNSILGIDGNKSDVPIVKVNFIFNCISYSTVFSVFDLEKSFGTIEKETDIQIHGILGNEFFIENGWILDFDKLTVSSSNK